MAHSVGQLGGDLFKAGAKISQIPKQNVKAIAAATEREMIRSQPKNFKQWDERQWRLKGPDQRGARAYANLVGLGLVSISEHGSFHKPVGWRIYPKGYTVAGSSRNPGVRYVGRTRIDKANRALAREAAGKKVRLSENERYRTKRVVLAFKGSGGTQFSKSAWHRHMRGGHFMKAAAARATERSGELVTRNVVRTLGSFR